MEHAMYVFIVLYCFLIVCIPSSSKCVSMPPGPETEQTSLAFRKVLQRLIKLRFPPTSFWQTDTQYHYVIWCNMRTVTWAHFKYNEQTGFQIPINNSLMLRCLLLEWFSKLNNMVSSLRLCLIVSQSKRL